MEDKNLTVIGSYSTRDEALSVIAIVSYRINL